MHYTCPVAKQRNGGLASVWIQLAEPQYVCLSGSQVEQLAITIPLLHVHNHHQTERMTPPGIDGIGAYKTSHQSSYFQTIATVLWDRLGHGASIRVVLTHIQAK